MSKSPPIFKLQFKPGLIGRLAAAYSYGDDEVEALGQDVIKNKCINREQLLVLARWKSPRILFHVKKNSSAFIAETTRTAFAASDEHLRMGILTLLRGVAFPTASVLLHFGHRDPYPIIDFRALESLGVEQPSSYRFDFWWAYVTTCRELAEEHCGGDMRMLDRALWQWSKGREG